MFMCVKNIRIIISKSMKHSLHTYKPTNVIVRVITGMLSWAGERRKTTTTNARAKYN